MANSMYQVYSKSGCIFCDAAMELLDSKNLEYKEIKIDGPDNTDALQFVKEQGFTTVPQIYDNFGDHVGGYQDLKASFEKEWPENPAECHSL